MKYQNKSRLSPVPYEIRLTNLTIPLTSNNEPSIPFLTHEDYTSNPPPTASSMSLQAPIHLSPPLSPRTQAPPKPSSTPSPSAQAPEFASPGLSNVSVDGVESPAAALDYLQILETIPAVGESQRQWRWAVAELLPLSNEDRIDQILGEVGRMEVWIDNVGEKVGLMKMKLDEMEMDGGIVLASSKTTEVR